MTDPKTTSAEMEKNMPCGNCDAGCYAIGAVFIGVLMFGGCKSQREALIAAPRCKLKPKKICMGSRDFIVGSTFPIDVAKTLEDLV